MKYPHVPVRTLNNVQSYARAMPNGGLLAHPLHHSIFCIEVYADASFDNKDDQNIQRALLVFLVQGSARVNLL